jgi:hypothetical protein
MRVYPGSHKRLERTFSLDARAVVPTTAGLTIAIPSAGNIKINATNATSGTAFRTGASHGAAIEPSRKYEQARIR